MGNRLNCVGTDKAIVAQEQASEHIVTPDLPDMTLQLAQYEAKMRLQQYPDNDNGCNKFLTREMWNDYKNRKCEQGVPFKTCIAAGGASDDGGIGVYAGSPSAYKIFHKFFDPVIQDYHGHGPKDRHFTEMSAHGLENYEFGKHDAALVNSTIISVERNFEGFPLGPGVLKLHRMQIMDLVRSACETFSEDLQGTFYPLEGMSKDVQNQLQMEDFLFNSTSSISNFEEEQWEPGRAVYHNNDKTLLLWVNEKNHIRISSMCQGVDIKGCFDRLIKATNHIQTVCKYAHDKHYGYFTPCPTNLGTALLASVLLSLPRLKKDRDAFEAIVDQYQLKVSGFNDQEEIHDETIDGTVQDEATDIFYLNQQQEDDILCISNKIVIGRSEKQLVQDLINCVHKLLDTEQENDRAAVPIDKQSVSKLPVSLPSLREVLTRAFKDFQPDHMTNIVVALGNTGCGKSTLLSSMLLGSDQLAQKEIIDLVQRKKQGKIQKVEVKRKVIDYKSQDKIIMPIGHSLEKSETFFPILIKSPEHDFSYVDIAGLQDTGGSIMEYVNQFINKKIFSMAEQIRFIVPFTRDQIYDARGVQVAEQVTILLNIFHGDLVTMSKSIQPVVTKVKTNDDEFDLDHCRETLGRILEVCLENFMTEFELTQEVISEIEALKQRDGSNTTDIQTPPVQTPPNFQSENNDKQCITDKFVIYQKYKDLEMFFIDFRDRLILVDPIDRKICGASEENQATSVNKFVKIISQLPPLKGSDLFVPLSDDKYHKLVDMFQRENMKVAEEGCRFIDYVKATKKFDLDFSQNPAVKSLSDLIKFFMDNQLIEDIDQELDKLQNYCSSIQQQVNHEKIRAEVGDVGKFLLDNVKFIVQRRKEKNFNSMVKKMIDVVVRLQNLGKIPMDDQQKKKLDETLKKSSYFFKKLIDDMMRRPQELFQWAYELRMQDTFDSPPDYFTNYFFSFVIKDIDPMLVKLILSNKCKDGRIYVDKNVHFKLFTGPGFKHVFKYNRNEVNGVPFVIKDPSTVSAEDLNKERKSMGFFSKAFNNVQKNLLKKYGEAEHDVQFLLHQQGLIIQRGGLRLLTKKVVQDNGSVQVVWGDETNSNYQDAKMVVWTFKQCKKIKDSYYIEQLYGEIKPRMMCNKEDPQLWTNIQCSRTKNVLYEQSAWIIMVDQEDEQGNKSVPMSPSRQGVSPQRKPKSPVKYKH